jgi:cell division protein FtsB
VNAAPVKQEGFVEGIGAAIYRVRRRIATGLAVVLTVLLACYVVLGRNGVNNYEQKRVEDKQLHGQIEALEQENNSLKDHVGRLKSDPDAIEFEAREKLHYARPGEVIYTLNDQPQAGTEKAPGTAPGLGRSSN